MNEHVRIEHPDHPTRRGEGKKRRGGWFVTDEELLEILGVPFNEGRRIIQQLDENPRMGFPQKSKLWCGRRYLPAVRQWLDDKNGLKMDPPKGGHHER